MVEMMGTLVIMGIIGLAGVKMFNSAMNSHRANELIYEAQKRATTVAMQITAGNENLSVAEFSNPEGYTFGVVPNPYNVNQFNITLNIVPQDVCTQMKNAVGRQIRVISNDCTVLTFNNDLSQTEYASDNQTKTACQEAGKVWCASGDNGILGAGKCSETSNCCTEVVYDSECQSCNVNNGVVSDLNSGSCTLNGIANAGVCLSGVCVSPAVENGGECTSNADCGGNGSGYYCKITQYVQQGTLDYNNTDCYTGLTGTCTVVPRPTRLTATQKSLLRQAGFASSIVMGPTLNWWSANNWCQAQGTNLIPRSELGCTTGIYQCCKSGMSCQTSKWTNLWNGKTNIINTGMEAEVAKFADKMVALRRALGSAYFWTGTPYSNRAQNSNACYYSTFVPASGWLELNTRYTTTNYALCE